MSRTVVAEDEETLVTRIAKDISEVISMARAKAGACLSKELARFDIIVGDSEPVIAEGKDVADMEARIIEMAGKLAY